MDRTAPRAVSAASRDVASRLALYFWWRDGCWGTASPWALRSGGFNMVIDGDSDQRNVLPAHETGRGSHGDGRFLTASRRRVMQSLTSGLYRRTQKDLIAALNDVASAVSSTISLDEVLETIVERAKRITNTEKAALVLTHDHSVHLDADSLVVKGAREEHPQAWWAGQLQGIASSVFSSGEMYVDLNRENDAWLMCAPIRVQDRPIGLLCAINSRQHRFTPEQTDFLAILGAFAASAIENARLAEQTKYVLLASERDRIAREMHDGISQSLFGVALGLEVCRKQVMRDPASVAGRLEELQDMVDLSRSELRRFIYDLRPVKLQELGLVGAIEFWVHEVSVAKPVQTQVLVQGDQRTLRPSTEACLYSVAKEAISNSMKHSKARRLDVNIEYDEDSVVLRVADNGSGFDIEAVPASSGSMSGLGLRSIRERVAREGGHIEIASALAHGTRIEVRIPT